MVMNLPRITIVTVVFNLVKAKRQNDFQRCVESVHTQSYPGEIEHLVIDGGSKDGTVDILDALLAERKITSFITEPDDDVYHAMNKGIQLATGKYVAFLNSDDFYHDRLGLSQTVALLENEQSDYCYGDALVVDIHTGKRHIWQGSLGKVPFANHYCHQTMFVKRTVLYSLHGFDTNYTISSDSDLCIRILKAGYKGTHNPYCFVTYSSGGGISAVYRDQSKIDHSKSFYEHYGKKQGLSIEDAQLLWQFNGIRNKRISISKAVEIGSKLGNQAWVLRYFMLLLFGKGFLKRFIFEKFQGRVLKIRPRAKS